MHRHNVIILTESTRPDSPQLLHVTTDTQQQTHVYTECTNVRSSLTADPEHSQMPVVIKLEQLRFVDGPDSQLTLDGRDERGSLEQGTSKSINSLWKLLDIVELVMQPQYGHVLFSSTLL